MKELIRRMIDKWFCLHTWVEYAKTHEYIGPKRDAPAFINQTLICSKCGKIKQIQL